MGSGFFDYLFDSEYQQRRDIGKTQDELFYVQLANQGLAEQVTALREALQARTHELVEVHATLVAMADLLMERGALDRAELEKRTREAFADLTRPRSAPADPRPPGGGPYREMAAPESSTMVSCVACNTTLPLTSSNLDEDGHLCDPCFAKRSR
jgi:hypothetical protein